MFPNCYIEGIGLTAFKIVSEYIVMALEILAVGITIRKSLFDRFVKQLIITTGILLIISGMDFTLYTDVFGITNFVGHIFRFYAYYLIYLAFLKNNIQEPLNMMLKSVRVNERSIRELNLQFEKELSKINIRLSSKTMNL